VGRQVEPLEADLLNGVGFLDEIRSESIPGLSSIEMVFEKGTEDFISSALDNMQLLLLIGLARAA
jgi:Cu/Ag efflux pump CusA